MKNKLFFAGFTGIILVFGIIAIACNTGTSSGGSNFGGTGGNSGSKTVTIKYQLTGDLETVNTITYKNSTGGTNTLNNVTLPWVESFPITIKAGSIYTATISGSSYTGGSLTAKIFVNGNEEKSVTSSGDGYFIVTAAEIISNY